MFGYILGKKIEYVLKGDDFYFSSQIMSKNCENMYVGKNN